jgi:polar amino acid transport system permease protein/polar amino acid transport system substrate-binding protein
MAMARVILPQAVRTMIPALINQYIITLKDTSIISVIGVRELTQNGKLIIANNFRSTEIWFTVGVMYFITIYILSQIGRVIERKLSYAQSKN